MVDLPTYLRNQDFLKMKHERQKLTCDVFFCEWEKSHTHERQ
jgi:hypothetical protein